ncbi:MAG: septum formation initiator family protein [Sphingobacteriales bacterium]|nr:MAG: septum formation initiator family protein [Sphingobacteriales bacterium]
MKILTRIFKNKYLITGSVFLVWMLFFDRNDLASQLDYRDDVNKLKAEKEFYIKEIAQVEKDLTELTTDQQKLEKFAREKYLMKKDNEDVFVVVEEGE